MVCPMAVRSRSLERTFLDVSNMRGLVTGVISTICANTRCSRFLLFGCLLVGTVDRNEVCPGSVNANRTLARDTIRFENASGLLPFVSDRFGRTNIGAGAPGRERIVFVSTVFGTRCSMGMLTDTFGVSGTSFVNELFLVSG